MSTITHYFGDGINELPVDADPNTTAPSSERLFVVPDGNGNCKGYVLVPDGSSVTLQVWQYEPVWSQWFVAGAANPIGAGYLDNANVTQTNGMGWVRGATLFFQVTAVSGTTRVGFGIYDA
jgi:hypothetical protein